jgi:two-component system, sensor histidine kinase PdtaS
MDDKGINKIKDDKQWLVRSLNMANIGNWRWDIKNDVVIWTDELYKIYGLDQNTFKASFKGYLERIHPDDRERVKGLIETALKTKQKVTFEERIVRPDNEVRYLRSWGGVKTDESGVPVKMYGTCVDITEIKMKDIAQMKKGKEYETVFERVTDAFVAIDNDWNYTYVNKKAAEIFGKKPEELVGKNIWKEFPDGVDKPFYKAYHEAMENQQYQNIQDFYPPYKKWFVNHIYPSHDGLTIYFEDITTQKGLEEALNTYKQELEEKVKERTLELEKQNEIINRQKGEIQDIIKELHHRVKNNMQIISSLLSLQSGMVDDPAVKEMFNDCQNRVHSMALIHEKMYQSNSLTKVNAKDYIPDLINDIIKTSSLVKSIDLDLKIDSIELGTKIMVPIGLLINEIVLNSIKHAFPNSDKGKIVCKFIKMDGNKCKLILGDNGVGMDKKKPFKNGSLGMDIIDSFVAQLDGTYTVSTNGGAVYDIEFKVEQ